MYDFIDTFDFSIHKVLKFLRILRKFRIPSLDLRIRFRFIRQDLDRILL